MRIVVAGPAGRYGGLEIHRAELVQFLQAEGHDVHSIRVPTVRAGVTSLISKAFFWVRALTDSFLFRPSLLISIGIGQGYSLLALISWPKCFSLQQIVTDDFIGNRSRLSALLKPFNALGPQTLTLKQQINRFFTSAVPPSAILPCFHQLDSDWCPVVGTSPPLEEGVRLAYFGRLAENKGLNLLLEALDHLRSPLLQCLDIWGSGPVHAKLHEQLLSHPQIASYVRLKGPYPSGVGYVTLLSSYHGLVLPSQACEGLPLVLLEAAAVGLPILSTTIGGIADFANANPDVVTVKCGLTPLCQGLDLFLRLIHDGKFLRARQQDFFQSNYSLSTIRSTWLSFLSNPADFVSEAS